MDAVMFRRERVVTRQLFYVITILLSTATSTPTDIAPYNTMVGNYYSRGGYWCQEANLPCKNSGQCCSGYCSEYTNLCDAPRNPNAKQWGYNACASTTCPWHTTCVVGAYGQPDCVPSNDYPVPPPCDPECPTGYMCKVFSDVYPPFSKCVVDDPCQGMPCDRGYVCEYVAGLSPWPPKCVPNPCSLIDCAPQFTCRVIPKSFPTAGQCVPRGSCAAISCMSGYVCDTIPNTYTNKARCVLSYVDPCITVQCINGFTCQPQPYVFPPKPQCVLISKDPCASIKCPPGFNCAVQNYFGNRRATCELVHPCVTNRNPCKSNEICVEKQVQCFAAPCPPMVECVPRNPCTGNTSPCKPGEVCVEKQVQCFAPPCPPIAECRPIPMNPCFTMKCSSGHTCQEIQTACYVPPCSPVGKCVLTSPCSAYPAPCNLATQICLEKQVQCFAAPCPPRAECFPRNF